MLRRGFAVLAVLALAVTGLPLFAQPASAIGAPIQVSAAKLPTWQANGVVWATASAQGLVFAGGTFTRIRPPGQPDTVPGPPDSDGNPTTVPNPQDQNASNLAVFDAATGNPTSCVLNVTGTDATVRSLNVSPDGNTLYVGGMFTGIGGVSRSSLAAVDVASCTVKSWNPGANGYTKAITSTATTVYVGGSMSKVGGQSHQEIAAISATTGAASSAFTGAFTGTQQDGAPTPDVNALALKPDNSALVVGGNFDTVNGTASHALGVIDPTTGATIKTFAGFITPYVSALNLGSAVKTIIVDSTGFYLGAEGSGKFVFDGRMSFNWDTYALRWKDACLGATQALLDYHDVLYIASHAHDCSAIKQYGDGSRRHFLAETTGSGTLDTSNPSLLGWDPDTSDGIGEGIGPRTLTLATSGGQDYVWSGGEFTIVNGVAQQSLTRFGTVGVSGANSAGQVVSPVETLTSYKAGQVNVNIRTPYDTDDGTLTYNVYRDGGSSPVYSTTAFSLLWNRPQVTWTDNQTAGSTHTYRVEATDGTNTTSSGTSSITVASTTSAYAQRVDSDGPLFHLRYDETAGLFLNDSSGNNNNLKLNSTANVGYQGAGALAGDPSHSLAFNGDATNYAVTEKRFDAPTTFSLETWFKTSTADGGKLIGFTDSQQLPSQTYDARNPQLHLADKLIYMTDSGQLIFGTESTPGTFNTLTTSGTYKNNAWHYVVATQDSHGMSLYVDGNRVAQNTITSNGGGNGFWRIGGDSITGWPSSPDSGYFDGSMDETAVYTRALSAQEVSEHFSLGGGAFQNGPTDFYGKTVYNDQPLFQWRLNETSGTVAADATGSGTRGTYTGTATFSQPSAVAGTSGATAKSVKFDGSSTQVHSATSSASLPQYTTEAWVKTTSTTGGQIAGFGSSATGDSSTQDRKTWFRNDGKISFGVRQGSAYTVITSPSAYNDGKFHHVVATKSNTLMALYVDGQQVANQTVTANQSYTGYWRFGEDTMSGWTGGSSSKFLNGTFDELAVYNSALSPNTIAAHYSAGAPTAGPDVAAPTAPENLTAGLTSNDVALTWRASLDNVGVSGYEIHRSTTAGFTPSSSDLIGTVSGSTTSYTDSNIAQGTYYYRVIAFDAAGNTSSSTQASIVATDVTPPSVPANVVATGGTASASLSWDASTDNSGNVAGYTVYRSSTSGFTPSSTTLVGSPTTNSYTDTPPVNGTYYYRITAQDGAGNSSAASAQVSATVADTTPPTAPTNLVGTTTAATSTVNLSWTAATDNGAVTGYRVYRSATGNFSTTGLTPIKTVTGTTATDTPGVGTWFYQVTAIDAPGNESPSSNEVRDFVATTQAISPLADTYVVKNQASTNFGGSSFLSSNGPTAASASISYLRFQVPTTPAGTQVSGASLQLRTTTQAKCGCPPASIDTQNVTLANDTWTEGTSTGASGQTADGMTYSNKAAFVGSTIGSIASVPNVDTSYLINLDPATMQAQTGAEITLAVQGAANPADPNSVGTDGATFVSQNASTVANRPQLIVTYSPQGYDPQAPTQPVHLAYTRTGGTVHITWDPSTDDSGTPTYKVYRSPTGNFSPSASNLVGSPSTSSFDDTPGAIGNYYYKITAVDTTNHVSPPSDELLVSIPDYTPPTAPGSVTLSSSGPSVAINWTASTDDTGVQSYEIHRSTVSGFTPSASNLVTTVTSSQTSATDTAPAGTFYYLVVAVDAAGNATPSTEASITLTDTTAPTVPSNLAASQSGATVNLTWTASSDDFQVKQYNVYRSTAAGVVPSATTLIGHSTSASFADTTAAGGPQNWVVTAVDPSGNESAVSNEVNLTVTDATAPTAVTDLSGTRDNNNVDLSWSAATDNTGVTAYRIYRSSSPGVTATSDELVGTTPDATPSYVDPAGVGTWYYAVAAIDAANNVAPLSNEIMVAVDDRTPPSAPTNLADTIDNSTATVNLTWTQSTDDVAVDHYDIYRSQTQGFAISEDTYFDSTATDVGSYSDRPGDGTWYYKVVAVDTANNSSTSPSNEVSAVLSDTVAPTAPSSLTVSQTTTSADLSWTASTDAFGVSEYDIYRSTTNGFTPSAATLVTTTTSNSYSDTTVALGTTYYYVVTAKDAKGNTSAASNQASITVSDKTAPTAPTLTAALSGTSVKLSWTASTDNVAVTGYEVHRSTDPAFVASAANLVTTAGSTATTYTDNPGPGTWYYQVVAIDAAGNGGASNTASATVTSTPTVVTLTPTADALTNQGAASTNYGTNTSLLVNGGTSAQAVSYLRYVIPAAPSGKVLTGAVFKFHTSTDSSAATTDTEALRVAGDSWTESAITWNNRPAVSSTTVGTFAGGAATNTQYSANLDTTATAALSGQVTLALVDTTGANGMYFWSRNFSTVASQPTLVLTYNAGGPADTTPPTAPTNVAATVTAGGVGLSWTASTDAVGVTGYDVFRSSTSGFTASSANKVGTSTTTSYTDTPGAGTWYYVVQAHDAAANQSPSSNQASATIAPDTQAPTAPGTPSAVVSGSTVTLSWTASTDNVGVTGYEIHRSATSGFTPSSTTLVKTVSGASSTSTTDAPGTGTWYYVIVAKDAAGNGGPSTQVTATTTGGTPTTTTVSPSADTFANQGAASTNYGSNSSLLSKGGTSSAAVSYLRFVIPAAPAGKTLTGATLRIHTSNDSTAGSTDSHSITVANNTWTESALNWNNKPAYNGALLGTITGAKAVSTSYDTALNVSNLTSLLGTTQSFGISDTGTDGMYFWSSNYSTVASRPQLILTFS